jgi:hypothetical protein
MTISLRLHELRKIIPLLTTPNREQQPGELAYKPYRPQSKKIVPPKAVDLTTKSKRLIDPKAPTVKEVAIQILEKPSRIEKVYFGEYDLPKDLKYLTKHHKTLILNLLNSSVLSLDNLDDVVCGSKLGDDSPMILFTGYDVFVHPNSIELRLFDGVWYQSMAIRLPHTYNQVLVHIKNYTNQNNWHLKISNKSGRYIPY